jgi:hypothetical protein
MDLFTNKRCRNNECWELCGLSGLDDGDGREDALHSCVTWMHFALLLYEWNEWLSFLAFPR